MPLPCWPIAAVTRGTCACASATGRCLPCCRRISRTCGSTCSCSTHSIQQVCPPRQTAAVMAPCRQRVILLPHLDRSHMVQITLSTQRMAGKDLIARTFTCNQCNCAQMHEDTAQTIPTFQTLPLTGMHPPVMLATYCLPCTACHVLLD